MKRKLAVTTTFLILFWGVFVSCQSDTSEIESTATAVSTQQAQVATETAVPLTNTPTSEPTSTATATLAPTIPPTATATATATSTAVPAPTFALTQREPTLAEIEEFLSQSPVLFFSQTGDVELLALNDFISEYNLSEFTEIFYEDVNGDEDMDLIVADLNLIGWKPGFVIVTLWNKNQYSTPFMILDGAKYTPGLRVTFEDWTNDAIPEVIFDFSSDTGGPGFLETTWKRYVIHCQTSCNVAWQGITGQLSTYNSVGLITTDFEKSIDDVSIPNISVTNHSFYAPDVSGNGGPNFTSYRVLTTTESTFTWDGIRFQQNDQKVLSAEYSVIGEPILLAANQIYGAAAISTELNKSDPYRYIYSCLLILNDYPVSESFECLPDFTKIFWQDITNDGEEELVVLATGLGTQQLLAFELNGPEISQIADVTGDIIRSDLFGVHLEDIDDDGQLEILAGRGYVTEGSDCKVYDDIYPDPTEICWWNELNLWEEVYRWDGQQFVPESEE